MVHQTQRRMKTPLRLKFIFFGMLMMLTEAIIPGHSPEYALMAILLIGIYSILKQTEHKEQ